MMDRRSQRPIWKVEELLFAAKRERERKRKEFSENYLRHARLHATAVAAIVLSGDPKIDEPLSQAWTRSLKHYRIRNANGTQIDRQIAAAQQLVSIILGHKEASARFTKIFRAAPVWLLNFTQTFIDAGCLKFVLPNITSWRPKWGRDGYEQSRQWPLLPSCTIAAGDPVPDEEARFWPFPLMEEAYSTEDSQKQEDDRSPEADLLTDLPLLAELMDHPEKEKELSRYEKLRLRDLLEDIGQSRRKLRGSSPGLR
jgi:hypothetical protein